MREVGAMRSDVHRGTTTMSVFLNVGKVQAETQRLVQRLQETLHRAFLDFMHVITAMSNTRDSGELSLAIASTLGGQRTHKIGRAHV